MGVSVIMISPTVSIASTFSGSDSHNYSDFIDDDFWEDFFSDFCFSFFPPSGSSSSSSSGNYIAINNNVPNTTPTQNKAITRIIRRVAHHGKESTSI